MSITPFYSNEGKPKVRPYIHSLQETVCDRLHKNGMFWFSCFSIFEKREYVVLFYVVGISYDAVFYMVWNAKCFHNTLWVFQSTSILFWNTFGVSSGGQSTQLSYLSRSIDTVIESYSSKNESHPVKYYLSRSIDTVIESYSSKNESHPVKYYLSKILKVFGFKYT